MKYQNILFSREIRRLIFDILGNNKRNVENQALATFWTGFAILLWCSWRFVKWNNRSIRTFLAAFSNVADIVRIKSSCKDSHVLNTPEYHTKTNSTTMSACMLTVVIGYSGSEKAHSARKQILIPQMCKCKYCSEFHERGGSLILTDSWKKRFKFSRIKFKCWYSWSRLRDSHVLLYI